MVQRSLFWDGAVLGDCGPYTHTHLHDQFFRSILTTSPTVEGVVRGWRDELLPSGASSPITVAAGGGVVYGMFYDADEAMTVSIPTPSSGLSRYDLIVLQRNWATQTVRLGRVAGVAAAVPGMPSATQGAGAIWEITLAYLLVDDAGTITLTDARQYCSFATEWLANIVEAGMYEQGAVNETHVLDRTRWELKGAGQIEPAAANPCTWVAGASYDYWQFADAAFNWGWVYFLAPYDLVGVTVDFYVWSVPDVNGAGIGVENCQWDYSIYSGPGDGALTNTAGTTNVDQQARLNTTIYADLIVNGLNVVTGDLIAFRRSRDGAADSYNSNMRLLGVEMRWTADA